MWSLKTLLYLKFYESFSTVSANRNMIYGLEEMYLHELPCKFPLTKFSVLTSKIGDCIFGTKIQSKD